MAYSVKATPTVATTRVGGRRRRNAWPPPPRPRILTSTNPSDVNILHLRDLFTSANLSCHRFPIHDLNGQVEPVDPHKLTLALSHSSVVVSVFSSSSPVFPLPFQLTRSQGELVGFGRAVSDKGLTASIHDIVVHPSFQGLGIGRRIVNTISRILTGQGIYDISALCSEKERLFFEACGFGGDILASTTMMYTKTPLDDNCKENNVVVSAGRRLLLVPPSRKPCDYLK